MVDDSARQSPFIVPKPFLGPFGRLNHLREKKLPGKRLFKLKGNVSGTPGRSSPVRRNKGER
jgi:hypothetical protein